MDSSSCKQLCKLMAGGISVQSKLGQGSEFMFEIALPINPEEPVIIALLEYTSHPLKLVIVPDVPIIVVSEKSKFSKLILVSLINFEIDIFKSSRVNTMVSGPSVYTSFDIINVTFAESFAIVKLPTKDPENRSESVIPVTVYGKYAPSAEFVVVKVKTSVDPSLMESIIGNDVTLIELSS